MAHDVISTCPVCEHELSVTRLHCGECGTTLEGQFSVGRFGRLSREQLALLESFLRARGNLRDMERELGISYPTVRGRVEALVRAVGLAGASADQAAIEEAGADAIGERVVDATESAASSARRALLERVARGDLTADQAASALRALGTQPQARSGARQE